MILPLFLSLRFLCLFPCLHLCLSKGMWRCGCVVLISSGQGPVMGGREEPERVMERGVVRHTELRPHPVKKKSQKTLQKSFCRKLQKGGKPKTRYSDMKIHTLAAYHQSLTLSGLGGLHCAPLVTYLRISGQIHVQAHWINLTFFSYELWVNEARLIFRSAKRHTYMDISCKRLKLHHLVTELKYEHIFEYFTIQKFSSQWSTWPKTHTQKVKVLFLNQKDFMMAKITFLRLFC